MTKKEAIKLHRTMWNIIADKTESTGKIVRERQAFDIMLLSAKLKKPFLYNFCCEYAEQCNYSGFICENCPIDWQRKKNGAYCYDSLYGQWIKAVERGDFKKAASLARHIANLPKR